jgi:hypothetical protein
MFNFKIPKMRLVIFLTLSIIVLQLNSCASQDAPAIKKDKKVQVTKNKSKGKTLSPSSPTEEDAREISDKELNLKEEKEQLMGESVITYFNIIEVNKDQRVSDDPTNTAGGVTKEEEKLSKQSPEEYSEEDLPIQGQKVKLMIQNNHNIAMWYLMPASGEKEMPEDGKFRVNVDADPPFLGKKFEQAGGQLVELIYHGQEGQSFRAFYVEAGSSLLFRNYNLGTYREGDYVPFWSAKELDVNDNISLKKWLPFSVMSTDNIVMYNKTESGSAKWIDMAKNAKFSQEKINYIQAGGITRYQIPVGLIR